MSVSMSIKPDTFQLSYADTAYSTCSVTILKAVMIIYFPVYLLHNDAFSVSDYIA
jgi:hypothetical protein